MLESEARMILNVKSKTTRGGGLGGTIITHCSHLRLSLKRRLLSTAPTHGIYSRSQAHEQLTKMNDPAKGGSKYLQEKISNARDCLVELQAAAESGSQSDAGTKESSK